MSDNKTKTIASVTKAIEIIEYIAHSDDGVGVTEISRGLDYGVSSTYHLLNTLRKCNIVVRDKKTKKYTLGLKLWQIGLLAFGQNHISTTLKPYLKKLKNLTGETANLTIMDKNEVVYIAQEESDKLVRMFTTTGATAPLHCTAAGKVFLAHKPSAIVKSILDKIELSRYTKNTITDKKSLIREIKDVKAKGYALDNEEREEGVSCIGAPVFDINNEIIACITVSGPTSRFTAENKSKWINIVLDVVNQATDYLNTIN